MSKVLLVIGHPDLSQSKANAALVDAVRDLAHVTVHDLYTTYPDFQIDADAERALLAEHDVIVFQHPVYWYNTTPLFKQWQDKVYTPEGANQATLETLLSNWHATLRLCQFDIQPMVKVYGTAFGLTDEDLRTAAKQYNELIASYAD
jgi:glutathione-regulated potassium-efflux system ancillary protein KefG